MILAEFMFMSSCILWFSALTWQNKRTHGNRFAFSRICEHCRVSRVPHIKVKEHVLVLYLHLSLITFFLNQQWSIADKAQLVWTEGPFCGTADGAYPSVIVFQRYSRVKTRSVSRWVALGEDERQSWPKSNNAGWMSWRRSLSNASTVLCLLYLMQNQKCFGTVHVLHHIATLSVYSRRFVTATTTKEKVIEIKKTTGPLWLTPVTRRATLPTCCGS